MGCLHAGIGQTHINNVLSTINPPTISSSKFKLREREVGKAVEDVAKTSCLDSLNKEKAQPLKDGFQRDEDIIWFRFLARLTWAGRREAKDITTILAMQQ